MKVYVDVVVTFGGDTDFGSDALIFGGSASDVVDLLLGWQRWGIDGARLRPAVNATDLPAIVDEVVPLLQRAGRFRTAYRDGETLRQRLGLPTATESVCEGELMRAGDDAVGHAPTSGRYPHPLAGDEAMRRSGAMTEVPLSILDLSPISAGSDAASALHNTVELAQRAEQWGYRRFWIAEHHFVGVASSAPAVLIGQIAAATNTIRVGAAAVQLGHTTAAAVVESFGMLDAFYPGTHRPWPGPGAATRQRIQAQAAVGQEPSAATMA